MCLTLTLQVIVTRSVRHAGHPADPREERDLQPGRQLQRQETALGDLAGAAERSHKVNAYQGFGMYDVSCVVTVCAIVAGMLYNLWIMTELWTYIAITNRSGGVGVGGCI